jgi:hypothetical protein
MTRRYLALIVLAACSTVQLPPPAAPPATVRPPAIELGAPGPGSSRVRIDSDEPARVDDVTDHVVIGRHSGSVVHLVCYVTPCDAHLTRGPHVLEFSQPTAPGAAPPMSSSASSRAR